MIGALMRSGGLAAVGIAIVVNTMGCGPKAVVVEKTQVNEATTAANPRLSAEAIPAGVPEGAPLPAASIDSTVAGIGEPLEVREIKVIEDNGQRGVFVKLNRAPVGLSHALLDDPARVTIDVAGPVAPLRPQRFPVSDAVINQVAVAERGGSLHLTIDLRPGSAAQYSYTVDDLNDTVIAFFGEPKGNSQPVREQVVFSRRATAVAQAGPAARPESRPLPVIQDESGESGGRERSMAPRGSSGGGRQNYSGPHVSMDFKDADVHNVLRLLAEVSKLNLVATDDVQGKVTLRLFDVPWDQALDIVLQVLGLESVQEGNVIRISTVKRLREEREELVRAQDAARKVEAVHVEYIRVNYAKASKLASIILGGVTEGAQQAAGFQGVLSQRGSVLVDDGTNTLIVRDVQRGIDSVRELMRQLDVQTPQILIESNIVEATSEFSRNMGIQWGYRTNIGPETGTSTGANFPGSISAGGSTLGGGGAAGGVPFIADFPAAGNFGAGLGSAYSVLLGSVDGSQALAVRITALEERGKAKVVSRPRVVTLNNVAATIKSLTIIRVKLPGTGTVINTGQGGAAGGSSTATEKIETGITLIVTPQVSSDGFVLLDMFAKSSVADFTRTVDGIPAEVSREANSHVLVKDGQTVVLGGIYRDQLQDQNKGTPFMMNLPVLKWLFQTEGKSDRREDLLVFITPRVLGGVNPALPSAEELWGNRDQPHPY